MKSSDDPPSRRGSFLRRWQRALLRRLGGEPHSKDEVIDILRGARDRAMFDSDALAMLEGVLQVSDLRVRDIMIPRAQMAVVSRDSPFHEVLPVVIESAHSRFPVIGEDRGDVVGILLAKDLLQFCGQEPSVFKIREILRSAVFVPESKRLNVLLKEFRASRNHMAVVVDEYGSAAGLVTIEDVLEQIVGEIEDEHDFDEGGFILKRGENDFTIKGHTAIDDFNDYFGTEFDDENFDTIGGLIINALGHMPRRGEHATVGEFRFEILRADSRRVRLVAARREVDEGE